jgi:ribosomal protein L16 Arg81 hydroxylase
LELSLENSVGKVLISATSQSLCHFSIVISRQFLKIAKTREILQAENSCEISQEIRRLALLSTLIGNFFGNFFGNFVENYESTETSINSEDNSETPEEAEISARNQLEISAKSSGLEIKGIGKVSLFEFSHKFPEWKETEINGILTLMKGQ